MYRYYLNDILLKDEPIGWDSFVESLQRDDSVRGLFLKYPLSLTFWGDGWKILDDNFNANGFCPSHTLKIQEFNRGVYKTMFNGLIFLSDAKFDLSKNLVECPVEDNNYGAKIYNNKSVTVQLDETKSKNGVTINPATETRVSGDVITQGHRLYDIKECFRFLIDYMSDLSIGFESTWLDSLGVIERFGIMRGIDLRLKNGVHAPRISFQLLFDELNKKFNIGFLIEKDTAGNPVIRIELDSYFKNNPSILTLNNLDGVERTFDNELLYSLVKIGSTNIIAYDYADLTPRQQVPDYPLLTFKEESYTLKGECNIDKTLNLVSAWNIDHNLIRKKLDNVGYEDFDDEIFLIQYDLNLSNPTYPQFTVSDYLDNGLAVFYNERLLNSSVADRWNILYPLMAIQNEKDNTFNAVISADSSVVTQSPSGTPVPYTPVFNDDYLLGRDPNNNYGGDGFSTVPQGDPVNSANARFTALASDLYNLNSFIYRFEYNVQIETLTQIQDVDADVLTFSLIVKHYDLGGSVLNTTVEDFEDFTNPGNPGVITLSGSFNRTMLAQNYLKMTLSVTFNVGGTPYDLEFKILENSFWKSLAPLEADFTVDTNVPSQYFVAKYIFEKSIGFDNWEAIKTDPAGTITFNTDGVNNINARIRKIERTSADSTAKWELISNI